MASSTNIRWGFSISLVLLAVGVISFLLNGEVLAVSQLSSQETTGYQLEHEHSTGDATSSNTSNGVDYPATTEDLSRDNAPSLMDGVLDEGSGTDSVTSFNLVSAELGQNSSRTYTIASGGGSPDVTSVVASPITPGGEAEYDITFSTHRTIQANSGELWVRFDKNFGVPSAISKSGITLISAQVTGGVSNPLIDPTVEVVTTTSDATLLNDTLVKITIGDTNPGTPTTTEDLRPGDGHRLIFSGSAGISNPTNSSTTAHLIRLSDDAGATWGQPVAVVIQRELTLSPNSGPRGTAVTAVGKGFSNTGTATLFVDSNDDGILAAGEFIIGTGISVSAGSFSHEFVTDTNFSGAQSINAIDGSGTAVSTTTNPTFVTVGLVTVDKAVAARGETVNVTLSQYTASALVTSVKFGGVEAAAGLSAAARTISTTGTLTMTLTVPTTTPLGIQEVAVFGGGEAAVRTTTIEIVGSPLTVSPSTAVPGQTVTISGSGFTGGGSATVAANSITIGGTATLHPMLVIDNAGNLVVSLAVPVSGATLTAQTLKVRVTDSAGRTGSADLSIPERTLVLDPTESPRGSTVDATGAGFPAESFITLTYISAGTESTVGVIPSDSAGSWHTTFTVPSGPFVGIPSVNTVKASVNADFTLVTKSATHTVPPATIIVAPNRGPVGSDAILRGEGFPPFVPVTVITVGGISVLPTPLPSTGALGDFEANLFIPNLAEGPQSILVTAGALVATTTFDVLPAPVGVVVSPVGPGSFFSGGAEKYLVQADNVSDLGAGQAVFTYDPALFTVSSAAAGPGLDDCLTAVNTGTPGTVNLGLACDGGRSGTPLTIWTVDLTATDVAVSTLAQFDTSDVTLGNSIEGEIPASGASVAVKIDPANCGDVHPAGGGDGDVDALDALRTLRIAVGVVTPDAKEQYTGDPHPDNDPDPDGDGDVDVLDALRILKDAVGLVEITSCGGPGG